MSVKNVSSPPVSEGKSDPKHPSKRFLTLTQVAKNALIALALVSLVCAVTSAVLFFHMSIPVASVALIASLVALGIFTLSLTYPSIEKKLPVPLQWVGAKIASLAKEFFSLLLTLGSITYGFFAKNKDPSSSGDTPLLLIHGYGMNSGHFAYLKYYLKKKGISPVYTINLGRFKSIDDYTEQVSAKVDQIRSKNKEKITIVGHSMGGIIAARYLANCADTDHIQQVITLGAPLQGTYTAYLAPGKCAKQMRPNSPFLNKLDKDLAHTGIPITTVDSHCDLIVLPNRNASFKSIQTSKQTYRSMGHNNYLFSDHIAEFIFKKTSCT